MKVFWTGVWIVLALTQMSQASPLTFEERTALNQQRVIERLFIEPIFETQHGPEGLIGYQKNWFVNATTYFGIGIYGIATGEKGGFGIVDIGGGVRKPLSEKLEVDIQLFVGSGGGGDVPGGGGFVWETQAGLGYKIHRDLFFEVKAGYLDFRSGPFKSPFVTIGFASQFFQVNL